MDTHNEKSGFPENVLRYSALAYFQKKISAKCKALPNHFDSLDSWEKFRGGLIAALEAKLPLWKLKDARRSIVTARANLEHNLILESVDVHFEDEFFIPIHI